MKKVYITPTLEVVRMMTMQVLAGSGITGPQGTSYGGIDHNGTHDPSAPHHHYKEDEEDEEEEDW